MQSHVQVVSVSHRNDLLISWRLAQLISGFSLRETYLIINIGRHFHIFTEMTDNILLTRFKIIIHREGAEV